MAQTNSIGSLSGLDSSLTQTTTSAKKNSAEVDKTDFLQLLVTQLKNQDPLNPMENQEFAVQLAQFSQLEQLVSINEKVGSTESLGDFSSLASFLGHEVVLNSDEVQVKDGNGGRVSFDLSSSASNVEIDLLNANGSVRETISAGALGAGKHSVELSGLTTQSGTFGIKVRGTATTGGQLNPEAFASGIVSGFIPGADPKLIVDGREIGTSDIREVRTAA